jgi:hypothetical protein
VFTTQTQGAANVLVFGLLAKTRANTVTISYTRAEGYTVVHVYADALRMAKQFEGLRSESVI